MLLTEECLSFVDAAKRVPLINGKQVHSTTVWRWARRGVRGVKLECRLLGGRFITSVEALDRFFENQARAVFGDDPEE